MSGTGRAVGAVAAFYLAAAVIGRLLEAAGLRRCGCSTECWCRRPGISAFRWVFPYRHR